MDFSGLGYYIPSELSGEALTAYRSYMDGLFAAYRKLLDADVPKEDARFLLPYAFCSNFYCTLNARELMLIVRLRTCTRAQWEIRHVAMGILRLLREQYPALFDRFGPSCYLTGQCPEGRMSCGRQEEMRELFGGKLS